nr:hypothetical protein [Chloroflexia bacterium]
MSTPALSGPNRFFGGTPDRSAGRSVLSAPRAAAALWWLAAKRNGGLFLLPVIAAAMWWLVRDSHQYQAVVLWMPTVQGVGNSLVVAGPLVAALASWIAGRSRRRGMTDLLATAPLPGGWAVVAEWLGIVAWVLLAYLGSAGVALLWTATEVTWGGPVLWPIIVAAVALAVCAAGGLFLGNVWPNRFLPPLLAIAVAALIVAPIGVRQLDRVKMLSPMGPIDSAVREPLVQVDDRVVLPHLLWLTALGLTLLLALVAWRSGRWLPRVLLMASVLAAVFAANPLVGYETGSDDVRAFEPIPYEPQCATDVVTVCVHPAYERRHGEVVTAINAIAQPLADIDRVTMRFEQSVGWDSPPSDVVSFYLYGDEMLDGSLAHQVPMQIVADWPAMAAHQGPAAGGLTAAQAIVAAWLTREYELRTGIETPLSFTDMSMNESASIVPLSMVVEGLPFLSCHQEAAQTQGCEFDAVAGREVQARVDAATERFLAMDSATRRAWLNANWTDLRAGQVALE